MNPNVVSAQSYERYEQSYDATSGRTGNLSSRISHSAVWIRNTNMGGENLAYDPITSDASRAAALYNFTI